MNGNISAYRICAAVAALVGGVFLVVAVGSSETTSGCSQDVFAPVEAAVGGEHGAESLSTSAESGSYSARSRFSPAVQFPTSECGPAEPVRALTTRAAPLLRLTEQGDWGAQSTDPHTVDRVTLPRRVASVKARDLQVGHSSLLVSRTRGTLETVRSVVLRI